MRKITFLMAVLGLTFFSYSQSNLIPCQCDQDSMNSDSFIGCGGVNSFYSSESAAESASNTGDGDAMYIFSDNGLDINEAGNYQFCYAYMTDSNQTAVSYKNYFGLVNLLDSNWSRSYAVYADGECQEALSVTEESNGFMKVSGLIPNTEYNFCVEMEVFSDVSSAKVLSSEFYLYDSSPAIQSDSLFTIIPDSNFERYLIEQGWDDIIDGRVLTQNIDTVQSVRLHIVEDNQYQYSYIESLTGIEDFTSLKWLDCDSTNVDSLKLNSLPLLEKLECPWGLGYLDVSNNSNLKYIDCSGSLISTFDFSNNPLLEHLDLSNNSSIISLDLSNNTKLKEINCSYSSLQSIDISNCIFLEVLTVFVTSISEIDLSNNVNLVRIDASSTDIRMVDLSNNVNLVSVDFNNTDLMHMIDLSNCKKLRSVELGQCDSLKAINLSTVDSLYSLYIYGSFSLKCIEVSEMMVDSFSSYTHIRDHDDMNYEVTSSCYGCSIGYNLVDTLVFFVSNSSFESISPLFNFMGVDTLSTVNDGCDSVVWRYVRFEYNPYFYTDSISVEDTLNITLSISTDLEEIEDELKVWSDGSSIFFESVLGEGYAFELISITGSLVLDLDDTSVSSSISLNGITEGTYIAKFTSLSDPMVSTTKKIVLR